MKETIQDLNTEIETIEKTQTKGITGTEIMRKCQEPQTQA